MLSQLRAKFLRWKILRRKEAYPPTGTVSVEFEKLKYEKVLQRRKQVNVVRCKQARTIQESVLWKKKLQLEEQYREAHRQFNEKLTCYRKGSIP